MLRVEVVGGGKKFGWKRERDDEEESIELEPFSGGLVN